MAHRKTIKHYETIRCFHELTFSCYRRKKLLIDDVWRHMLADSVSRAILRLDFQLTAWVFMPEHVHLLVLPDHIDCKISGLLSAIKRPFSFRIKKLLQESGSYLLDQLTIRQRPGVSTFRFWQEGPGYDRNIETDRAIEKVIEYIHLNPVRRGLCEKITDWKWSSARFYAGHSKKEDLPIGCISGITHPINSPTVK